MRADRLPSVEDRATQARLVIFDFDGTIAQLVVDWAGLKQKLQRLTAATTGQTVVFSSLNRVLAVVIADHPDLRSTLWQTVARFEQATPDALQPNARVLELIRALAPDKPVAVFSTNMHASLDFYLRRLHIRDSIRLIVGKDDVIRTKPDADGLHRILTHFRLPPQDVLFVGNDNLDRQAGAAAGVPTYILPSSSP